MFFVLTKRLYRKVTGAIEKFEPRTANSFVETFSGPFSTRKRAEIVAVKATGSHTIISATVMTAEQVKAVADNYKTDYYLQAEAKRAIATLEPEAV